MANRASSQVLRCVPLPALVAGAIAMGACIAAQAQSGAAAKPRPVPAKPAAAKPAPAKTAAAKPSVRKPAPPAKAAPAEAVAHLPLSTAQQAIAAGVHVGSIPCELGQTVELLPIEGMLGFFKLRHAKATYTVAPEETSTGAVRLEDRANGIVWLQLANKSMLMNQKLGRRMADECMSPPQLLVAREMQRNPPPSLLDAPSPRPAGGGGADAAPRLAGQAAASP